MRITVFFFPHDKFLELEWEVHFKTFDLYCQFDMDSHVIFLGCYNKAVFLTLTYNEDSSKSLRF